jgi:hypothetical protein
VAKDKYINLAGHPDVRIRVDRLDGNWSRRDIEIWWDRELITFMAPASPAVKTIVDAETKIMGAIRAVDVDPGSAHSEVTMFQGTFVKVEVWCPAGTAKRLGIKGYGK